MGDRIGCQTPNDVASDGGYDRLYVRPQVRVRIFSTNTSYYLHTFRYIIYTYIDIKVWAQTVGSFPSRSLLVVPLP